MRRRLTAILVIFVLSAGAAVLLKAVLAGPADDSAPTADNPLPVVLAGGEARPTFTPIPAPDSATLISEDRAIDLALERMGSTAERGSVSTLRSVVGQTNVSLHDPDYPVWLVTATGTFHYMFPKLGQPAEEYSEMTVILDAVDGKVLGLTWGPANP